MKGLRQPDANIIFPFPARCLQKVDAAACADSCQPCRGVVDRMKVRCDPSQKRVLDGIFGIAMGSKKSVGEIEKELSLALKERNATRFVRYAAAFSAAASRRI